MKNLLYIWWVSRDLFHSLYFNKNLQSGPMVVHCSAGIGRSGAFIVCDMICDLIKKNGPQCIINIKDAVKHCRLVNVNQTFTDRLVDGPGDPWGFIDIKKTNFREHRPGMVQTEDQYKFIYRAIEHHVNKIKSWYHMTFKSRDWSGRSNSCPSSPKFCCLKSFLSSCMKLWTL